MSSRVSCCFDGVARRYRRHAAANFPDFNTRSLTAAAASSAERTGITYVDFAQWQKAQQAFESIALFNRRSFNVATDDGADRMDGAAMTADFARVLGIEPILGRMFTAEEDRVFELAHVARPLSPNSGDGAPLVSKPMPDFRKVDDSKARGS